MGFPGRERIAQALRSIYADSYSITQAICSGYSDSYNIAWSVSVQKEHDEICPKEERSTQ